MAEPVAASTSEGAPMQAELPPLSLTTTLNLSHLPDQTPPPSLYSHLLTTALEWITTFSEWPTLKSSPVELRRITNGGDVWAGRASTHQSRAEKGTATFAEFKAGLLDKHSYNEGAYTPDVYAAVQVGSWAAEASGWTDVVIAVYEMYHSIPVLSDRFFTTCVITARRSPTEFLVVQLPFDIRSLPPTLQQHSQRQPALPAPKFQHKSDAPSEAGGSYIDAAAAKRKDGAALVEGRYVSVEHVVASGAGEDGAEQVTWRMGTASDAAGKIPQWVTDKSLPGQVAKDVGFFLEWSEKRRKGA